MDIQHRELRCQVSGLSYVTVEKINSPCVHIFRAMHTLNSITTLFDVPPSFVGSAKQPINTSKQPIKIDAFKVPFRADAVVPAGPMRRPVCPRHGPCLRPCHHHLQPSHHGGALSRGGGGVRCDAFVR